MRTALFTSVLSLVIVSVSFAQTPDRSALEKGVNLLETKVYTEEENARILKMYESLRVADVSDGLDMVGLP